MKYIELVIEAPIEKIEEVKNILFKNDIYVFEEVTVDALNDLNKTKDQWDFVDESLLNVDSDNFIIKAYFNEMGEDENIKSLIFQLKSIGKININLVDEKDWENCWKEYYKTTKIGNNIVIKPTWEKYSPIGNEIIVEMDPGMAFGSGTHETTSMCIELLESHMSKGDRVFDIGCGSGILSIVAAKLGASKVTGVDIDENSIKVSRENIINNNVESQITLHKGDLLSLIEDKADLIVSNIIAEIIIVIIPDLEKYLEKEGTFICSGIISDKKNLVIEKLVEHNFKVTETRIMGEWVALAAQKI